ncbi:ABC transporter ATP-binding protein [Sanguibacter hominis ATCC BAA-789]|uniref:ABC transporter ATP-binding protein n=1 Tax=Sanguibacter hominis ATCC BAA-789 TaxID=1312740 RepID=A0A9X5FJ83_9MICO|nr:ABC transporter ATP-binding protein [Sanguibacter hominis ATCC BAA-789]
MESAPRDGDDDVVAIRRLTKSFGRTTAIDALDLTVRKGAVTGFLGPNGAGKSTTLRIVMGLLRADGGSIEVLGADPWRDAVALHHRVAYVPGDVNLWPSLTGGEVIDLLVRLRGYDRAPRREEMLERFDLDPSRKVRTYSKGNRQKVALVAALAVDAELLVLDEPTSGLDPLMEAQFATCVREATQRGASVLLSSHILAEVEKLCDTVTIVRAGRTAESGTLAELRHLTRSTVTAVTAVEPDGLAALDGVHDVVTERHRDSFRSTLQVDGAGLALLLSRLALVEPQSLTVAPPSLEELFLRHYGDELQPDEGIDRDPRARR